MRGAGLPSSAAYDEGALRRIARAVRIDEGRVRDAAPAFEAAARWYRLDRAGPRRTAPSHLVRRLNAIEKNAKRLLQSLRIPNAESAADGPADPELADALTLLDERDSTALLRASARLGRLAALLAGMRAAAETCSRAALAAAETRRVGRSVVPPGNRGDRAVNDWIAAMMTIYRDLTGRKPGRSVGAPGRPDRGRAGGPLIRFLAAAGAPLGLDHTPEGWAQRARLVLRQSDRRI